MINLTRFLFNILVSVSGCESTPTEALNLFLWQFEWKANLTLLPAPLSCERSISPTPQSSFPGWNAAWWDLQLSLLNNKMKFCQERGSRAGGIPFHICIYCVRAYVWGGVHTVYSLRPRLHLCWYFSKHASFFFFFAPLSLSTIQIRRFRPHTLRFFSLIGFSEIFSAHHC